MSNTALDELRTLTVDELSHATGIQEWRIYEMLKKGEAPHTSALDPRIDSR